MARVRSSTPITEVVSGRLRNAAIAAVVALALPVCGSDSSSETRQEAVAERGREVMPFNLEATTHRFVAVVVGLVQTIVADDPTDETEVDLVRSHLRAEASRFERGDFDDPARIHGQDMPGLARLRRHGGAIAVTYRSIAGAARSPSEPPTANSSRHSTPGRTRKPVTTETTLIPDGRSDAPAGDGWWPAWREHTPEGRTACSSGRCISAPPSRPEPTGHAVAADPHPEVRYREEPLDQRSPASDLEVGVELQLSRIGNGGGHGQASIALVRDGSG